MKKTLKQTEFEQIYQEYSGRIYTFAMVISEGDTYLSEEILQVTFTKLWEHWGELKSKEKVLSYLFTTAKHIFLNYCNHEMVKKIYSDYIQTHQNYIDNYTELENDAKSLEELKPLYGVMLTDGTSDYFFAAQGRRNYYDCNLDIFNSNKECPVPWSGYYWTTTSVEGNASALFFDLNTTRSINGFDNNRAMERANALPVRCVKVL